MKVHAVKKKAGQKKRIFRKYSQEQLAVIYSNFAGGYLFHRIQLLAAVWDTDCI